MLDLDDLWVGDVVVLKKSGRIGKFEGIRGKKALIRIGDKVVITTAANLEEYKEERQRPTLVFEENHTTDKHPELSYNSLAFSSSSREIDLHINVLAPHLENEHNIRILDYQIEAFERYIDVAYQKKYNTVKIIHGKGEGKLRNEVRQRLATDPRIKFKVPIHQDGATEVWFDYGRE